MNSSRVMAPVGATEVPASRPRFSTPYLRQKAAVASDEPTPELLEGERVRAPLVHCGHSGARSRYCGTGTPAAGGWTVSGMTQDERSKSMNSSAFACGDRSAVMQPPGGGELSVVAGSPPTCRSLKTARPQYWGGPPSGRGGAFTGVSNEKYIVEALIPASEV